MRPSMRRQPMPGRDVLLLACLILPAAQGEAPAAAPAMRELLDQLEFTSGDRQRALNAALGASTLLARLELAERPSQLADALAGASVEEITLVGALGHLQSRERPTAAARRWLDDLRHVHLEITGKDLLAAGVPAGPAVGARLAATLAKRLDGELGDAPQEQLRAALRDPS